MVSSTTDRPHAIVIGGGPAGATASTLIAQQGYRVELFERETFPRYHIGESMIPESFWVLERLGMLPKLHGTRFVKKHSVQFVTGTGKLSEPFYFADNKPHESSQTWQVARAEFDLMMLNNAREHGVNVHEGARVLEVIFEGSRAVGVTLAEGDGQRQVFADVVIDAAGQSTMIQDRLGLREWDPVLKKAALWTYWKGAYRDTGKDEGATIVLQLDQKQGWFWYIPLADDMLSVGVVAPHEYLFKNRGCSRASRMPRRPPPSGPPRNIPTGPAMWPGMAGCWWGMPMVFSTRSIPQVCSWPCAQAPWRPMPSARGWPRETPRRRSWASGAPPSMREWTGCAGWYANFTTASTSAAL